jgi:hypothetical protein
LRFSLLFALVGLVVASNAEGQNIWLQADNFIFTQEDSLNIRLLTGEGFNSVPTKLNITDITRAELHQTDKHKNIRTLFTESGEYNLNMKLDGTGTHLIVVESTANVRQQQAETFNEMLKAEGLDDVLYHRKQNNDLIKSARELSSCHSKLLIQVGNQPDKTYSKQACQ